jgi:hypothetical protein
LAAWLKKMVGQLKQKILMVPINYGKKGDKELSFAKQGIGIIRVRPTLHQLVTSSTCRFAN